MSRHTTKAIKRRQRIRSRLRKAAAGRARLTVFRSSKHIYAQLIDDGTGRTLAATSSLKLGSVQSGDKESHKIAAAREVGKQIAELAKGKGIQTVRFDRGGYLYHGRVKALADAAREAGLEF